jgi:hypothetical protein
VLRDTCAPHQPTNRRDVLNYLKTYRTPPACYRRAPVRRQTPLEGFIRTYGNIMDHRREARDLVPHAGAPKKLIG